MKIVIFLSIIALVAASNPFLAIDHKIKHNPLVAGGIPWNFTTCASNGDITITGVLVESTPTKGQNDGVSFVGKTNAAIQLDDVSIDVSVGGSHLATLSSPFSKVFSAGSPFSWTYQVNIPSFAPSGAYSINFSFMDANQVSHGCANVVFNF